MKKTILSGLFATLLCVSANASDGGLYSDTETYTSHVRYNTNTITYHGNYAPVATSRPCTRAAAPVRVKTHSEVIDHYQLYRPVTVYEPAGTYSERRIVNAAPCGRCNG